MVRRQYPLVLLAKHGGGKVERWKVKGDKWLKLNCGKAAG